VSPSSQTNRSPISRYECLVTTMSEQDRITKLESQLQEALNRISELEGKVQTMRGNINATFDAHAKVLGIICKHDSVPGEYGRNIRDGIDVGKGQ
jgi:hypothetical protein